MIKKINYNDLVFWGENPRYGLNANHDTAKDAIEALFTLNQTKMTNLAKDIAEYGLLPNDLPIVVPLPDGKYKVYEGNRRIACIYSLHDSSYLNYKPSLKSTFDSIDKGSTPTEIMCYIESDLAKVYRFIDRIHSGEQDGVGRTTWGSTEKNIIKELKNSLRENSSDATKGQKQKPHYQLLKDYPHTFKDLISTIKPTNVDRILEKKVFRDILNTDDYSNIKPKESKAIASTLTYAHSQSQDFPGGLSRKYNEPEIERDLVPYYLDKLSKMTSDKHNDTVIKLSTTNTRKNQGERIALSDFILNSDDFEKIDFIPSPNLILDENGVVISTNEPGKYNVTFRGLIDGEESATALFDITIVAKKEVVAKSSNKLFKHDFASTYTIDISDPINSFIFQANKLSLAIYPYVANVCLRIVLEDSLAIFIRNKSLSTKDSFPSTLEKNLHLFKLYFDTRKTSDLDKKAKLGFKKLTKIIQETSPSALSQELHPLAHNILTIKKSEIENLANRVSNILIIISEELKPTT